MYARGVIAFLGAGTLAEAIIRGGLVAGSLRADQLLVSARSAERKRALAAMGFEVLEGTGRLEAADLVILGVRHHDMPALLEENAAALEGKLVLSLALGVTTRHLKAALPRSRVIRCVPNTPAEVREAVTLLCRGPVATDADVARASALFRPLGKVLELPEALLDTANAVSGTGPAFIFAFVEAFTRAAVKAGLPVDVANQAIRQTVTGAARMLRDGDDPVELIRSVATPGGSTRAGLEVLKAANLEELFHEAIVSGRVRAEERSAESDVNFARWLNQG